MQIEKEESTSAISGAESHASDPSNRCSILFRHDRRSTLWRPEDLLKARETEGIGNLLGAEVAICGRMSVARICAWCFSFVSADGHCGTLSVHVYPWF